MQINFLSQDEWGQQDLPKPAVVNESPNSGHSEHCNHLPGQLDQQDSSLSVAVVVFASDQGLNPAGVQTETTFSTDRMEPNNGLTNIII